MINQINIEGKSKIDIAIERLKQFEPKEEPYYVAISGGKDSDVIVKLCELAGVKYELHHQHTTADAPQTVRYIRETYPSCIIDYPEIPIWKLIEKQGVPPTRLMRYCCKVLKEYGGEGRTKVLGVRWSESTGRKNNRKMVELCYKNYTKTINPIIDWTEQEVWEYIRSRNINYCSLYDQGYKRLGCIGCPNDSHRIEVLQKYPKFYDNYLKAIERWLPSYLERCEKVGRKPIGTTPQELMDWWLECEGKDYSDSFLSEEGFE